MTGGVGVLEEGWSTLLTQLLFASKWGFVLSRSSEWYSVVSFLTRNSVLTSMTSLHVCISVLALLAATPRSYLIGRGTGSCLVRRSSRRCWRAAWVIAL